MLLLQPKALVPSQLTSTAIPAHYERRALQVTQACNSPSEQARSRSGWLIHGLESGYLRLLQAASGAHRVGQTEEEHHYIKASSALPSTF